MPTPAPISEFTLRRRVQFYELDSAGIVHFSCYFRYMEEAEHAMWRDAGLSIAPRGSDLGFPRVAVNCEYHKPLRFEDEFEIHIRVVAMSERSIRYACVMTSGGSRVASGTLKVVCVRKQPDGSIRSTPMPPEITGRFAVAAGAGAEP